MGASPSPLARFAWHHSAWNRVNLHVVRVTNGAQQPWEYYMALQTAFSLVFILFSKELVRSRTCSFAEQEIVSVERKMRFNFRRVGEVLCHQTIQCPEYLLYNSSILRFKHLKVKKKRVSVWKIISGSIQFHEQDGTDRSSRENLHLMRLSELNSCLAPVLPPNSLERWNRIKAATCKTVASPYLLYSESERVNEERKWEWLRYC